MKRLLLIINLALASISFAQDGILDGTFGNGGKVTTALFSNTNYNEVITSLAVKSNGTIVAAGYGLSDFIIATYNSNGMLITESSTDIDNSSDGINSIAVQTDGKIVAAGYSTKSLNTDIALARYDIYGNLDNSFSDDGKVKTALGSDNDAANSIVIQSDGKIVVAGYSFQSSNGFAIVRYNANGTLDNTFGFGGSTITQVNPIGNESANALAMQSDGKFVAAGFVFNNSNNDFALVRYNSNGTIDNSFGNSGIVTTQIGSGNDVAYSISIQSDGKILVAGSSVNGSFTNIAIARYNSNGTLDNTFAGDGTLTTSVGIGNSQANSIAVQSDGKIVVVGTSNNGANNDFVVIRYFINGNIDFTFGFTGIITDSFGSSHDYGKAVAIQSDGKIVVAGNFQNTINNDIGIARYNNPSLPVELISFNAAVNENKVVLNWQTSTEVNNYGFEIERSVVGTSRDLSLQWETLGFIEGHGNSNSPKEYSFTDEPTESGTYSYRLKQIDFDGKFEYSEILTVEMLRATSLPTEFALEQNYPNPFNPATSIEYSVPSSEYVSLKVYDILGNEVAHLVNENKNAGRYEVKLDASNLTSGIYIYKIQAGSFNQVRKMMLIK